MLRWLVLLLLLFISSCWGQPNPAASSLPVCPPQAVQGRVRFATGSCTWPQQTPAPSSSSLQLVGEQAGVFPGVVLRGARDSLVEASPPGPGLRLTIKRLVLLNVTVAPPNSSAPKLLPLGLFSRPVANLSMMDVRLSVAPDILQQYLEFFSKYLLAVRTKNDGGVGMHTDGTSFLNIPHWSDGNTELYSVTVVTGPCIIPQQKLSKGIAGVLVNMSYVPGCNVRSATNDTLIPILLRDATINTTQPLLIRLVSNVTLGLNIQRPIVFARPVLILGASCSLVSVDLNMVVNQFNVTRRNAQLAWQAVVLENLAPGDATSAMTAPPYSTTVTTNVWAVYCNRSRNMCVPLTNVTLVIPSPDEISYLTFMSTMYNSPSPSLRDLAGFYRTDLKMTAFDVAQGPTNDSLKVLRLVTNMWNMWYVLLQTQPVLAPPLPAPRQVFDQLQSRTGVVVHAISDCSALQSTQGLAPNRVHVWQLMGNVSIGGRSCTFSPSLNVTGPTTLIGDVASTTNAPPRDVPSMRQYPLGTALPGPNSSTGAATANSSPPPAPAAADAVEFDQVYSLAFQYTPGLIQIPPGSPDRRLNIQNITLWQLPQAAPSQVSTAASRPGRRLMQGGASAAVGSIAPLDTHIPPGSMTILLWPFNRSMSGAPLTIADSQLMLPQPEWQLIADAAKNSRNFAVQLEDSGDLIFASVSLLDGNVVTVGSFRGPGITGNNIRLLPDSQAAAAMPSYSWPAAAVAAAAVSGSVNPGSSSQSGGSGLSSAAKAAIGVCVGVLGALAVAAGALLFARRRKKQHQLQDPRFKRLAVVPLAAAGAAPARAGSAGALLRPKSLHVAGQDSPGLASGSWNSDLGPGFDQDHELVGPASAGYAAAAAAAAAAARPPRRSKTSFESTDSNKRKSSDSNKTRGTAGSVGGPLQTAYSGFTAGSSSLETGSVFGSTTDAVTPRQLSESEQLELSIAQGLQQWNDAVSVQTIRLMQQRLQASSMRSLKRTHSIGTTCSSTQASTASAAAAGGRAGSRSGGASSSPNSQDLHLYDVIGTGSFGAVHLGSWRGKQVAVKVMHLPAHAFNNESSPQQVLQQQAQCQTQAGRQQHMRQQHMRQQNSRPHMAMMEAVLSTSLHHPNVVQVYTYMLNPLMASNKSSTHGSAAVSRQASLGAATAAPYQQQQQEGGDVAAEDAAAGIISSERHQITGWSLQLVMEFCDQGTLRDQLDRRQLPHLPNSSFLHPAVAVALSHDIAAAMMHLHKEGIVHGDLKAGNVLLQASTTASRAGSMQQKHTLLQVWMTAGCLPLVAKVADFGLALPLGPTDTHATLHARGTPTHMAPELFTDGHVSKSSDVFAFGILLYEIFTGQRAYSGVPIPLLPHRVAVEGLRPTWPSGVPCAMMRLAESCWMEKPQRRPNFYDILHTLESIDTSSCSVTAAVTGPVAQLTGVQAPTAEAAAAADAAAAAAAQMPTAALPPLPDRQHQVQPGVSPQQQQQQQGMERKGRGGGLFAAGNSPAKAGGNGAAQGAMDWSEVS